VGPRNFKFLGGAGGIGGKNRGLGAGKKGSEQKKKKGKLQGGKKGKKRVGGGLGKNGVWGDSKKWTVVEEEKYRGPT